MKRIHVIAIVLSCLSAAGLGAAPAASIAFLGTVNSGQDPRYDYLEPFVSGILMYDLSSSEGIALVDRSSLDAVLKEQEISMSLGSGDAVKLGSILGARWIAKAEFTAMGPEIALTLSLVDAQSAQSYVFSDRGSDENLIHGLAERLVKKASGRDVALRSDSSKRSLFSLKDEQPGSISLYTALIDAEILLDGAFVGFSPGSIKTPVKIEGVDPGVHEVGVKLDGFGMVVLPQVSYEPWRQKVEVKAGKNAAVKAEIRTYQDWYYKLKSLKDDSFILYPEKGKDAKDGKGAFDFADRTGAVHKVSYSYQASTLGGGGKISGSLVYDGKTVPFAVDCKAGKEAKGATAAGPISLNVTVGADSSFHCDFRVQMERTDLIDDEWK
jgi:TolB-like protein